MAEKLTFDVDDFRVRSRWFQNGGTVGSLDFEIHLFLINWNPGRLIFEETSMKLLKLTSDVIAFWIYIIYNMYLFMRYIVCETKTIAFFFA